jgi:hypothetical protein
MVLTDSMHEPSGTDDRSRGSAGRLIALILSAGLAWATAVTFLAWLAGRLFAHG